jgi:hypothetical protein
LVSDARRWCGSRAARLSKSTIGRPTIDPFSVELSLPAVWSCPIEEPMSDVEEHGSSRGVIGDGGFDALMRQTLQAV